jgi:hypothetical protein
MVMAIEYFQKTDIYLNDWLDMKEHPNQVVVYTQNKTTKLSGKYLELNSNNYSYTVSHQIWMDGYGLIPNYISDPTYVRIKIW